MSAPVLGAVGLGATLFSGMMGVKGAQAAGATQAGQYEYQAGLAEINAQSAKDNAEYTRRVGELKAMQYGLSAGQRTGAIKAGLGASGLDVNSGSARDVIASDELVKGMDLSMIRSNALKTAYDYDVQSTQFKNQAQLYRMGAEDAKTATKYNVASSILGTVTSVSSKWLQGNTLGMFSGGSKPTASTAINEPALLGIY